MNHCAAGADVRDSTLITYFYNMNFLGMNAKDPTAEHLSVITLTVLMVSFNAGWEFCFCVHAVVKSNKLCVPP